LIDTSFFSAGTMSYQLGLWAPALGQTLWQPWVEVSLGR
jgi:hypothetical protein